MESDSWNSFLIECLVKGRIDLFDEALASGADVGELEDGEDIVSMAVRTDRLDVIERILMAGANPNAKTEFGRTSLFNAVWGKGKNRVEIVKLLVKYGASADLDIDEDGESCVHTAAENGDLELLKILVESGAEACLRSFDDIDRTPLHCACKSGALEVVEYLLSCGIDVNANNEDRIGDTALSDVAQTCTPEMAKLLLEHGANPLIPGWMQLTAYDRALKRKKADGLKVIALIERYIQERGFTGQ